MNPTFYVVSGGWHTSNGSEIIKIGTTQHPENRKFDYVTTALIFPIYLHLFTITSEISDAHLKKLDSELYPRYLRSINMDHLHCMNGGGNELYFKGDHKTYISGFLTILGYTFTVSDVDPYDMRPVAPESKREPKEIDNFSLALLSGSSLRSIQEELWFRLKNILREREKVKGIIQWPTGLGKTIGITMTLWQLYSFYEERGEQLRAIIVCHMNDIINTTMKAYKKLLFCGIQILEGHNARLSTINFPNGSYVLIATHQGILARREHLPEFNCLFYDEVHHITGDKFYKYIQELSPEYLFGCSATPLTNINQSSSISTLFSDERNNFYPEIPHGSTLISQCSYSRAIREKWIAPPRMHIRIFNREYAYGEIANEVKKIIEKRKEDGLWIGKKCLVYFSEAIEVSRNGEKAIREVIDMPIYHANDNDGSAEDFQNCEEGIMVSCRKYQEGSDIKGLDVAISIVKDRIAPYILLQRIGRTLRTEYEGKYGDGFLLKFSENGETSDGVLMSIFDQLIAELGSGGEFSGGAGSDGDFISKATEVLELFIGDVKIDGEDIEKERTLKILEDL